MGNGICLNMMCGFKHGQEGRFLMLCIWTDMYENEILLGFCSLVPPFRFISTHTQSISQYLNRSPLNVKLND